MLHHSRPARRALVALTAVSFTLAACGGGDDDGDEAATATTAAAEATTPSTTTATTTAAPATTGAAAATTADESTEASTDASAATTVAESEDDTIIVGSFDDMPPECRELMIDFLKTIEPAVKDVDWTTATVGDFQTVSEELATEFDSMDQRVTETGCDAYDFAEDADSITPMIEIAEEEAPGTVGWLEFLATLDDEPVVSADLPTDCDGAIAYFEGVVTEGTTMNDVPFNEMTDLSQVLNTISTSCDPAVVSEFFARPEVSGFLG